MIVNGIQFRRHHPLDNVQERKQEKHCGVEAKKKYQPSDPMQFVGIIDAVKDLRNLHCDAEPKNIQGEKVKLPQIAKSMDQSSHFRWLSFDAFLDRVNNMERTYRKPDRVQRNATEEWSE
jgi:histidinol phosphatase-like enzyme